MHTCLDLLRSNTTPEYELNLRFSHQPITHMLLLSTMIREVAIILHSYRCLHRLIIN